MKRFLSDHAPSPTEVGPALAGWNIQPNRGFEPSTNVGSW